MAEASRRGLFRLGGLSAIALGLSYVLITVLYVLGGSLPNGAEDWLRYLAGHAAAWWTILALSILTDFLFLSVALALYIALKEVNRNAALVGTGLLAMFAILDLAVTWPNYSSLLTLSGRYAAAVNEVQRTVAISAATYASAVLSSTLFAVYAIFVPSLGILIIGLVMLKGAFSKLTAYAGLAAGIVGLVAVIGPFVLSALGASAIAASVLTTVWVLLVGARLCRLD